jgi:hypothetical protein
MTTPPANISAERISISPRSATEGCMRSYNRCARLLVISWILLACEIFGFAQQKPEFECSIHILNLDSANPEVIRKQFVNEIARFKIYETMEEERIDKFFRVPKTGWFVVASFWTTDESMLSKSGIGSIDMELSFATTRRRNIFKSPAVASSETPFKTFDIARVSTVTRLRKHRQHVTMECKAP